MKFKNHILISKSAIKKKLFVIFQLIHFNSFIYKMIYFDFGSDFGSDFCSDLGSVCAVIGVNPGGT